MGKVSIGSPMWLCRTCRVAVLARSRVASTSTALPANISFQAGVGDGWVHVERCAWYNYLSATTVSGTAL